MDRMASSLGTAFYNRPGHQSTWFSRASRRPGQGETRETAEQRILFERQEGAKFDLCAIDNL